MKRTAIDTIGVERCAGCFLCGDVCPTKAIEMHLDTEGFYKPSVNYDVCTNCGLCAKKCPVVSYEAKENAWKNPRAFTGWNSRNEVRMQSSSGGIFSHLASYVLGEGGVVCAVKWEKGIPVYGVAEREEDLEKFRGSKYLQADARGIYVTVRNWVKQGRKVLFVGLPCHVQGIKNWINSDLLYTVDLVCAGVPSLKMYDAFCLEMFKKTRIERTDFRNKREGWRHYSLVFMDEGKILLSQRSSENDFFLAFNSTKCYNKGCYTCTLNTFPRRGDITLCDHWGAADSAENHDGISGILINTNKGEDLLMKARLCEPSVLEINEENVETIISGNRRVNMASRVMPAERSQFFRALERKGFRYAYRKHIKRRLWDRVKNKLYRILNLNGRQ